MPTNTGSNVPREMHSRHSPAPAATERTPWPDTLREQIRAVKVLLADHRPRTTEEIAAVFHGARRVRVGKIMSTLEEIGQVRRCDQGWWMW